MKNLNDMGGGSLGGLLKSRAQQAPHKAALIFEGESYTYSEFDRLSTAAGTGLLGLGSAPGASVAIFMSNRPEFLFGLFGVMKAGMLQVPVNTAYKAGFLKNALHDSDTEILLTEAAMAPALASLEGFPSSVRSVVFVDGVPAEFGIPSVRILSWEDLLAMDTAGIELPPVHAHDMSAISFTSGTTGKSKGVVSPHLKSAMMGRETANALGTTSRDRVYTSLPLFHGAAQSAALMNALYAGATFVLSRRFSVSNFWREVREAEVTEIIALGSMLKLLLSAAPDDNDRNHQVQRVFAAPAPGDVLYPFEERFGVHIVEGYGQTEIKNVLYNPLQGRRVGSLGKPTPSSILEIHDEHGNSLAAGQVGEIVYRPREAGIMFSHYHNNPQATLEGMRDMWWHTGDLGYMDEEGFFYFVDRKKDSMRRRGENISSHELESAIGGFPGIADVAAVSVLSVVGEGEVLAAFESKDGGDFDYEALFRYCDSHLPRFMVPRYYRHVGKLPRTPSGKIMKVQLRDEGLNADVWDAEAAGFTPTRQI